MSKRPREGDGAPATAPAAPAPAPFRPPPIDVSQRSAFSLRAADAALRGAVQQLVLELVFGGGGGGGAQAHARRFLGERPEHAEIFANSN
jgi:hypothetical protein